MRREGRSRRSVLYGVRGEDPANRRGAIVTADAAASSPSPKPQRKVGLSVLIVLGLVLLLVVGGVWMFLRSLKSQSPADKPGDANTDAPAALGTRPDVQPGKLVADSAPP